MTKLLFTTLPSNDLGLLTRSLPVARELANRGHTICFCNPGKAPRKMIADAGFQNYLPDEPLYYFIAGDLSPQGLFRFIRSGRVKRNLASFIRCSRAFFQSSTAEVWNIDHFMTFFGMRDAHFIRANVDALIGIIRDWEVDAIVDFWNPFACIAARVTDKPLITIIQADMHPQSRGFIWWKQPPSDLPTPVPVVNQVMASYGLHPIRSIGELVIGDLTLVVGIPEMDPLPQRAGVTYIGPILWQSLNAKLPDWMSDLSADTPLIWVYPGNLRYVLGRSTSFDSAVVLRACIDALEDEAVQVILTTGHHSLPRRFLPLPSNFRHEPFVPGLAMAERSDLLIHHGGYGSCQTGLYTGTPAVIIPTFSERESNARRIAAQGAGDFVLPISDASGRKKHVRAQELRVKVNHVLYDSSFEENAKRVSERLKSYGGANEAGRLIEGFVQA